MERGKEMKEQELNTELLEWAGLHHNKPTGGFWWDEQGNQIFDFHNPNEEGLTQSLDACFRWLYPELKKKLSFLELEAFMKLWVNSFVWRNEEPALALCLAVEKLIDTKREVQWQTSTKNK